MWVKKENIKLIKKYLGSEIKQFLIYKKFTNNYQKDISIE